jgi:hypothetical protein
MKKFLGLVLVIAVLLSLSPTLSAAKVKKAYIRHKASMIRQLKCTTAEPIYCKITKEDLEKARAEAKEKKRAWFFGFLI